ncbi:uncharacterized protein LOC142234601 [Haematobia irritans]|uniref:uncharacterized protein LOC142234601 n=1 Tax=Haematobia irritans TaxID=7368 RepID=UPI003F508534
MVVSKRCKICTIIEPDNMPISGEYYGKLIPDLVEKITGIMLDPRKLVDVLICQQCTTQLVHVEAVVNRLRKSLLRLTKPAPKTATTSGRTPSKSTKKPAQTPKEKSPSKVNGDTNAVFKKFSDENVDSEKNLKDSTPAKKLKSVKRKLDTQYADTPKENGDQQVAKRKHDESNEENENEDNQNVDHRPDKTNAIEEGENNFEETFEADSQMEESEQLTNMNDTEKTTATLKQKVLNCVLCGKKFNQKSVLRDHIETKHMGEKLKECPNCSMEFRSLQKYESHVFGEKCKGTLHPCQFENCHRRFKNVYKMEAHMREKHLSLNGNEDD